MSFTISPVLREVAKLKAIELNRAKIAFAHRYDGEGQSSAEPDATKRVALLVEDIKKLDLDMEDDDGLAIISRYIEEAQDNQSVSKLKIRQFERQLNAKLDKHVTASRLEISSLYIELMRDVMDNADAGRTNSATALNTVIDDDFEVVEHRLDEILEAFEKETFTTRAVDVEAIEEFLATLFDESNKRHLEELRLNIQEVSDDGADGLGLDQDFFTWAVMDLLKSDAVSAQKKKTLEGYAQSPIAMRELLSIINMKSIRNWEYKEAEVGLPVAACLKADGQYQINAEEDLIDLLFLQCVGLSWCMNLKTALVDFVRGCSHFNDQPLSMNEFKTREFFLAGAPRMPMKTTVCSTCHPVYEVTPPPPGCFVHVPPPPPPPVMVIESSYRKKKKGAGRWSGISHYQDSLKDTRNTKYRNEFCVARLPAQEGCTPGIIEDTQAELMKTLAVEAKLRTTFDGYTQVAEMKFNALETSLPHKTILTVLKFLGVPEYFLDFSTRFLETKLNIGCAVRGAPDRVLTRACGVPAGHALSLFFTEAVMFLVELLVRQKTGVSLYRLKDECYFVGSLEQQQQFEEEVTRFADIMSLNVSVEEDAKIGFLIIEADGARINDSKVDAYARGMKEQLAAHTTVLDWVRVWNDTVGTYAAHLFGPLAEIFGKPHLDAVKRAYQRIFNIIFAGGDLTSHMKMLLAPHMKSLHTLTPASIEAFIYLPQAHGGLGVKNPFVTLSLARNMCATPDLYTTDYLAAEEKYYNRAAENWTKFSAEVRSNKIEYFFNNDDDAVAAALGPERDLTTFMTKEELTANRERASYPCLPFPTFPTPYFATVIPNPTDLYTDLLREPIDNITSSDKVSDEMRRLSGKGDMKSWHRLSGEDKWVLQLYSDECFQFYGGLEVWCGEYVPQEVLKTIRGQMWDEDDDDSCPSVSDMTEP